MAGPLVRRAWRGTAAVVSAMTWGIESPAASSRAGVEPSCRRTGGQEAGSRERGILGDSCDYAWITSCPEVSTRRILTPGWPTTQELAPLCFAFQRLANREQEDGTLAYCVRRKEVGHVIVEEGQPGRTQVLGVRGQVDLAADGPRL